VSDRPDKPRPIDKLRDGAGSIEIRTPDDDSAILEMISTSERLLIVKEKGIYEVKLADQVDPRADECRHAEHSPKDSSLRRR
jgi:hypothetical protein